MSFQPFALRADPTAAAKPEQFRADLNVRLTCPDCQDENVQLIEEFGSGDLVCGGCGLVLGDRIVDTRSEWRSFADSEGDDPSRVGGPQDPLLDASEQFNTIISFKDGNTGIARGLQMTASRVAKDQGSGRDLQSAFHDLTNMCEAISLPRSIVDTAKQLLKRVDDEKILKSTKQDAIIAACIFIACRQGRVARTFKEIVALTQVPKKEIGHAYKTIERALETVAPNQTSSHSVASAESLITRCCNHLGLAVPIQQACVTVGRKAAELELLAGRTPVTIAGACILFATHLWGVPVPTKEVSQVTGAQDSTIRNAFRLLLPDKEKIVDLTWFQPNRAIGTRADWANLAPKEKKESDVTTSTTNTPTTSTPATPAAVVENVDSEQQTGKTAAAETKSESF